MKIVGLSVLLLLVFLGSTSTALAQSKTKAHHSSASCEETSASLDVVGDKFHRHATNESFLIVLGSFPNGVSARSKDLIIRHATRYLTQFQKVEEERIRSGVNRSNS